MKTLKDYLSEAQQWYENPAVGDTLGINIKEDTLIESYIVAVTEDAVTIQGDQRIFELLSESGYACEDSCNECGYSVMECMCETTPVQEGQMKHEMMKNAERMSLDQFKDLYGDEDWIEEFWRVATGETEDLKDIDEAEYQGRKVPLGKPMRGDVKKFKVYVKDPATGNIKKVNFGHGGTSAKRLGQKTMKIKKSNPARRKSFRARHNCDNPGPRTKARYWSCRAW
jgi:hypothetical protein